MSTPSLGSVKPALIGPGPLLTSLVVGHDALLGEVRGLYGAERQLLHALGHMAGVVRLSRVKHALVNLVTGTGTRLWRLEECFALLDEEVTGSRNPSLQRIIDAQWMEQRHRLRHQLLELHLVGTTLQEVASHLSVVYAVAERRARALDLADIAAHLAASRTNAETIAPLVALHTGVHPEPPPRPSLTVG